MPESQRCILALDQGTTSTRVIVFTRTGRLWPSRKNPLPSDIQNRDGLSTTLKRLGKFGGGLLGQILEIALTWRRRSRFGPALSVSKWEQRLDRWRRAVVTARTL